MKSTVEPQEGNKVKLSIQVPSDAFEAEIDAAFKRIVLTAPLCIWAGAKLAGV